MWDDMVAEEGTRCPDVAWHRTLVDHVSVPNCRHAILCTEALRFASSRIPGGRRGEGEHQQGEAGRGGHDAGGAEVSGPNRNDPRLALPIFEAGLGEFSEWEFRAA